MLKRFFKSDRIWPTGLVVFATGFVAVNLAFVSMAFQNKPQLVSENYYAEGYNLREIVERKAAGEATGWTVTAQALPRSYADKPLLEVTVTKHNGQAADSLSGRVRFYRPSDQSLDIREDAALQFIGGGRYLVVLPRELEPGAWQALVHVERGLSALDERVPFRVKG